jgi:stage II sporulation protein D
VSPRIVDAQVIGTRGTVDVTGPQLRARLGLYDTWAYFTTIKSGSGDTSTQPQQPATDNTQVTDGGGVTAGASWLRRVVGPSQHELSGSVSPRADKITLQKRLGPNWKTIGYGTTDDRGRYALRLDSTGVYRILANRGVGPAIRVR